MSYLKRCGPNGGYIGCTTKAEEFRGLDLEQVQRALKGLISRGIVRQEGPLPRNILVDPSQF